jgi:phosphohistidine phosphatase SixA
MRPLTDYGVRGFVANRLAIGLLAILLTLLCAALPAVAQDSEAAWAALAAGGNVALVRHAIAPGAADEPPGFTLADCATQRNLDDEGRAQAATLGAALRAHGVEVGRVVSSPWCRCKDTAMAMGFTIFTVERAVGGMLPNPERKAEQLRTFRELVRSWTGPGTLVVVSHGTTIQALTGTTPYQAEIVVVAPQRSGAAAFTVVGRIPPP